MNGLTLTNWPPRQPEAVSRLLQAVLTEELTAVQPWIELAAEELLTNIFRHAYHGKKGKAVVQCQCKQWEEKTCACLSITDWGSPFDPFKEAPVPDVTLDSKRRDIGGLGVHLVKSVAWRYSYSRQEDSNVVEVFFVPPEA